MQDLRVAIRVLRAAPIVTGIAILSLALGIGANTAIFSLVNSLLLRTLPVPEPERLVIMTTDASAGRRNTDAWNYGLWEEIRRRAPQMFDGAVAWSATGTQDRLNLSTAGGEVQPVDSAYVSGDFFTTLGVPALLGRTFTSADDVRGGGPDGPAAVISYGMWQRRFGGDANVIGTSIVIERIPFTIIGVTPPEFFGAEVGRTFDVALPLHANQLIRGKDSDIDRGSVWLYIMVRLKPGQSAEAATSLLRSVQPQIREAVVPATLPPRSPGPRVASTRRSSVSQKPIHARARVHGHIATASAIRAAPPRDAGHRRAGASHRLRQHRQPAPRAGDRAPARIECAAGAGRDALASRAAAAR